MRRLGWWVAVVILTLILIFTQPSSPASTQKTLSRDGFEVHASVLSPSEVESLKHMENRDVKEQLMNNPRIKAIVESLGPGYEFQDYVFILKKSSIHTCHRDANGDLFNEGQSHPSYTIIVFLEGSDNCLEVAPGSHLGQKLNLQGTIPVPCRAGDMFLFDANLVHAGAIGPDRLRVQMKVTHRDDREKIWYYENYNKVADHENPLPDVIKGIHQRASCAFPFVADMVQDEVKKSYTGEQSDGQRAYSQFFYGNKDFYKLNDAF
jgi:hypothetical protein